MHIAMTNATSAEPEGSSPDWPARTWVSALAGALIGLAVQWLANDHPLFGSEASRFALATFLATCGLVGALTVERGTIRHALGFACLTGAILALVTWWNIPEGPGSGVFGWRFASGALATVLAVPLWLSWQRGTTPRLPYPALHRTSWTAALQCGGACLFVVIVWALAMLLSELFGLIGITALRTLFRQDWATFLLTGAAFGGGIGILRERSAMIAATQRATSAVLTVLAPVLAAGLVAFVAALPVTGLAPLWGATRATTPVLLCCILGALLLIGAAIGDGPDGEARHPAFRASVIALSAAILPLAVVAAISTGLRIDQRGLTPDRLWAVTFTAIACAYGLAYLVALIRRRTGLAGDIRQANPRLAIGVAAVAIMLATPLIPFGRIAAQDQASRLQRGAISVEAFDWMALRFDFGPAGPEALRRLAREGRTAEMRKAAAKALRQQERWPIAAPQPSVAPDRLTILPRGSALPPLLRARLADYDACFAYDHCVVLLQPTGTEAVIVNGTRVHVWRRTPAGNWAVIAQPRRSASSIAQALARGEVEIRTVQRRQVFVAGQPIDAPFE